MVLIEAFRIFVDAVTREVFYYYRDQPSGMVRRIYDLARPPPSPARRSSTRKRTQAHRRSRPEALLAFRNAGLVRDFYFLVFGRDGYDDNDGDRPRWAAPRSRPTSATAARRTPSGARPSPTTAPRATSWSTGRATPSAIDIVAHEMTHGVISHEKNLLYLNEPGAVNEIARRHLRHA